jgi:hypothetical protein
VIEHLGMGTGEPEENACTVGGLIGSLSGGPDLPIQFGGSSDALSFTGTSEMGAWVSIDFEQRVTRGENDALRVERETVNPSPRNSRYPQPTIRARKAPLSSMAFLVKEDETAAQFQLTSQPAALA